MRNSARKRSLTVPWERKFQVRRAGKIRARGFCGMKERTPNVSQWLDYNQSQIQRFFIVGGELGLKHFYTELSVFLLVVYVLVLIGNSMICTVVVLETKLHTPMYFFLANLSMADIIITTSVFPKMISMGLLNDVAISFAGCFLQLYTYLAFQSIESIILAVMAYDRYMAICNPLRYNEMVTPTVVALLSLSAWTLGTSLPLINVIPAARLPYCGDQVMFWFCDFPPVVAMSCVNPASYLLIALVTASVVLVIPLFVIVWTYGKIISAVCKIKSVDGRKKAFSTCSSHLTIVILFYGAHLIVYCSAMVENVHPNVLILVSIFNCFLTPFANPIIYSLRNKELKNAIVKHINRV